ncbi:lipocalin family protein [Spirosoma radiotolerans]|uniref:Lipocalin-like domain-containing protein n=1 Tax=Spirosoma radiotolerans TaxID=1379870 RepID=A0A0E3ZU98_9BACT|nr:lipocalin family protein [Spirosoma radiotolerans]AKD54395.1 hypothetical protein SD10_05195 [Spirosoma radiotolerans]
MKDLRLSRLFAWTLLIALPLWFGSCSKDDNPTIVDTPTVEGNYKISTLTIDPKALGLYSDLIAGSKLFFNNTTCLNDITITFKTGGDATTDNPMSCQSIPVPVSTFTGIDATSKWSLSGNQLTVTKGDGTKTAYTVLGTGAILKLQWQGTLNYPTPSSTMYTYTMELKKQ